MSGKAVEEAFVEWEKRLGADEVGAVFCDAVGDAVGGEEFGDGRRAALVPDLFEPAFEEIEIRFGHGSPFSDSEDCGDGITRGR
jgi:hypothetical protein